eukprot:CAMPEP_0184498536 /NCGR_PEP_ID=MMETSP0113_2-20130426/39255_1 /TAXON_ID=91329 /ORGANISM="Norrisiella sphaerica, Strain BC52" /LENGTH=41 /DNA_ID= /DNA_START= /DNA_END= /DNA_ORIENTATION=
MSDVGLQWKSSDPSVRVFRRDGLRGGEAYASTSSSTAIPPW